MIQYVCNVVSLKIEKREKSMRILEKMYLVYGIILIIAGVIIIYYKASLFLDGIILSFLGCCLLVLYCWLTKPSFSKIKKFFEKWNWK